ncbi:hypothetical protein CNR22_08005 [Sphingobacteriaceae bacterium]|nr:hypothetical protein CNR22_08005 [Sphingobacteriaceae bacterium]
MKSKLHKPISTIKNTSKKSILLFSFCLLAIISKATHNRAGEILYKRIAPFTQVKSGVTVNVYTYSITVIKYTDDGQGIADRCVDTVYFGDNTKGVAPRVNGATTCGCGSVNGSAIGCGSLIVNMPSYKVKYNEYTIIHTYPGAGSYLIRTFDPNRNGGVRNVPNSINIPFYIESMLVINASTGVNSSPVLTNPPVDQASLSICFTHNPGAVDADGDSLSYEISTPREQNGQTVPGYFDPESSWNGFTINPTTGLLSWCTPQYLAEYNVAFVVKEWRKNTFGTYQLNGYVLRDMQIIVKFGVVGINENDLSQSISMYPNPVSETLQFDFGTKLYKNVETMIYSVDGRLVFKNNANNVTGKSEHSLNALVRGIYSVSVKTESGTVTRKIVKD